VCKKRLGFGPKALNDVGAGFSRARVHARVPRHLRPLSFLIAPPEQLFVRHCHLHRDTESRPSRIQAKQLYRTAVSFRPHSLNHLRLRADVVRYELTACQRTVGSRSVLTKEMSKWERNSENSALLVRGQCSLHPCEPRLGQLASLAKSGAWQMLCLVSLTAICLSINSRLLH
jgi:hypothetical protein